MWPFTRKKKPKLIVEQGCGSSETWRPSDMAECVENGVWFTVGGEPATIKAPERGSRSMVLDVYMQDDLPGVLFLDLLGYESLWCACSFRKIVLDDTGADRTVKAPTPQPESVG